MIRHHDRRIFSHFKPIISVLLISFHAADAAYAANYQISAYLGGTTTGFPRSGQLYYDGETDLLVPTNNHINNFTWGGAAALRWKAPEQLQTIVSEFSFGPEFFYFSTAGVGEVWQYELPEMNNLTYRLPVKSFRLLATNEITFSPIVSNVNLFFEWGLGVAVNQSSYQEVPRPEYLWPGESLNPQRQYRFAYTLGGGLKLDISDRLGLKQHKLQLTMRYLYANLGSVVMNNIDNSALIEPLSLHLYTQSWVAGLSCLF